MSEEPRRSGRATKGQHNKASSSPAPDAKKGKAAASSTKGKKSAKKEQPEEEEDEEEDIRCICGDDNPDDKRPFISCDACTVWQHNVCMGMPEDDDDVPEHYFCEQCKPDEHWETLTAMEKGEKIWETRAKLHKAWKKMSAQRRKSKGKGGEEARPSWLKKEPPEPDTADGASQSQDTGTKRKRDSAVKAEQEQREATPTTEDKSLPQARPDKRRKSSQPAGKDATDASTAVVKIADLPAERKKFAEALSKTITDDVQKRSKSGFRIPEGSTAKSVGEKYGGLVEYSLFMNHGAPKEQSYKDQLRALLSNLKRNAVLVERLLNGSLTPDELSLMKEEDMMSEEKQLEQQKLKELLDRQAVAIQEEGPVYKQTHKGYEKVEDERHSAVETAHNPAPVRERMSVAEEGDHAGPAPVANAASPTDAKRPSLPGGDRRQSSQQNFDINSIWNKTAAHSPPVGTAQPVRPMPHQPPRRSSVQQAQHGADGAKEDPDVDRLLQDDDEDYNPAENYGDDTIVWRGKLIHETVGEPTVNARWVAGRDLSETVQWRTLLPSNLNIDGRLAVGKAEEYLCGLQYSNSSDVSVLALKPYDDADAFKKVFDYFSSRGRYAVVNGDKPRMVKDLYVIPVEKGSKLPDHIEKLEHCMVKEPVEDRVLLATFVVVRAPGLPPVAMPQPAAAPAGANGSHGSLPQHMRNGAGGPAGSPLNAQGPTFSPQQQQSAHQPLAGYGAPLQPTPPHSQASPFPPNPHGPQAVAQPLQQQFQPPPYQPSPMVQQILGPFAMAPVALEVLQAEPTIGQEKLSRLRHIFEENVAARTDVNALAAALALPTS
ncbi:hypothetical protein EJ03DRAFT_334157 [Teratosphaeria nubilosa]|uniref:Transcription factor BYE1 n=1 Tax=Teratosphaeria nubilosa TaxID=161662 RepID=A0A6G1LHB1_9PEZI|nr:hypothetical protein EJ03DRAFT_334157 [Teratosphaeria nubilosa]